MKRGTTRKLAIGLVVAVMGTLVWAGGAEAFWGFFRAKAKVPQTGQTTIYAPGDDGDIQVG